LFFTEKWPCCPGRRGKISGKARGSLERGRNPQSPSAEPGHQPNKKPPLQAQKTRSTRNQKTRSQLIRKLVRPNKFGLHSLSTISNTKFEHLRVCSLSL
jgi:hypothetical protein